MRSNIRMHLTGYSGLRPLSPAGDVGRCHGYAPYCSPPDRCGNSRGSFIRAIELRSVLLATKTGG